MVEIPDNNIDHKLGVKNLVVSNGNSNINKPPSLPIAKSRNNVDQCSATNNGSVIYVQSNIIKNGFNSFNGKNISTSSHNSIINNFDSNSRHKDSQQHDSNHNTINSKSNNNYSQSTINPKTPVDIHRQTNGKSTNEINNTLNSPKNNHNSKEDLNNIVNNSNKWSNGTLSTTSDILF